MDYACSLTNAISFGKHGMIEEWTHAYLLSDGNNQALSDGLKKTKRIFCPPVSFSLSLLTRNTGPEPEMRYQIHPEWFEYHVGELMEAVKAGADLPPLIVRYWIPDGASRGEFEINDGNHRLEAFRRLGVERYHVIFWCTAQHEYDQLMERYASLMSE